MESSTRKSLTKLSASVLLLLSFGCSSTPKGADDRALTGAELAGLLKSADCRFEQVKTNEKPDSLLSAFLSRETAGLLHHDQMDWLFQRQVCPGRETIADFIEVVTARSIRLVINLEEMREYEVEYNSKGVLILLNDSSDGVTLKWDERDAKPIRRVRMYRTPFGWKFDQPLFQRGEYLSPESILTLYSKRISEDFKKKLTRWVR
jgi:hypothetical protein